MRADAAPADFKFRVCPGLSCTADYYFQKAAFSPGYDPRAQALTPAVTLLESQVLPGRTFSHARMHHRHGV